MPAINRPADTSGDEAGHSGASAVPSPPTKSGATSGEISSGKPDAVQVDSGRALGYALFNIASASGIVFANKAVFAHHHFAFTYALTFCHTLVTVGGMAAAARAGLFRTVKLSVTQVAPIAVAFVAYIVFGNLNLRLNSVSFYQVSKIAVAPAILALELLMHRRVPPVRVVAAVGVVCVGIGFATVSELEGSSGLQGALVGGAAVLTTALYQVWVGSQQRALGLGSMQLLHASAPLSSALLAGLVLALEPTGLGLPPGTPPGPDTLRGFPYTPASLAAIALSALLGLAVSLSTFLVIGATSSLTYNVVGHIKTVIIIAGGVLLFDETLPPKKVYGLLLSLLGIIAYSVIKVREGTLVAPQPGQARKLQ
eukprot:jgi/Tetstr1/425175/TSEL_015636.t1